MEKKLIEWFTKTGYPFELWTESVLSKFDFFTTSSYLYQDEESNIFRELDLVASRSWDNKEKRVYFTLNLLIECKKSDKPFIILSNKKQKETSISIGEYYAVEDPVGLVAFKNPFDNLDLPGISSSGFKLIQGFTESDETPHKAVNTIIKSFNDYLKTEREMMDDLIDDNSHSVTFPLLLVDAPLFELKVDEENEINLKEIDSGKIYNLTHLGKSFPAEFPLLIIKKQSFENFLQSLNEFGEKQLQFLIDNPVNNIKNYHKVEFKFVPKDEQQ